MPRTTIRSEDITDAQVKTADMAIDPTNASNLSSGSVPLARLGNVDTSGIDSNKEDIALLAFKTQANGSLARYNLVDQSVDSFEDASGISASDSAYEVRNAAGKYYSGGGQNYPTGGTVTTHGSYRVHSFLSGSTNVVAAVAGTVDVLMVGGGGAGGSYHSGAGGAGGMIVGTGWTLPVGTSVAVVGAGGVGQAGNTSYAVNKGADSTFRGETALGGGGAGTYNLSGANPYAGGSTGGSGGGVAGGGPGTMTGAAGNQPNPTQPGTGYAFKGGDSQAGWTHAGGGGGGAGAVGGNASGTATAGAGGAGRDNDFRTGSNVTYAGGGGGGLWSGSTPGSGGSGGGGPGGTGQGAGTAGTANTGGGGGGFGGNNGTQVGADGGSGIIVMRYLTTEFVAYNDMILESNTITAQDAPTKGDLVFTYTNGAGTAVVGTNITAEYSADAGSTWTDFGIAAGDVQGTTGGHTIVTKNNVSLTSTSGTSMRYRIKTLVQSVSMDTRIHAVSLGWS